MYSYQWEVIPESEDRNGGLGRGVEWNRKGRTADYVQLMSRSPAWATEMDPSGLL